MRQPFFTINYSFSSFDEIVDIVKEWDIRISKLNKGDYKGSLFQIFNDKVIISDVNFCNTLKVEGTPPREYKSFGIPKINCAPFYWRNKNLADKTIQIYRSGSELFMINKYNMGAIDIAVAENHFYKLCKELKYDNVLDIINKNETLTCDLTLLRELQTRLAVISEKIRKLESSKYYLLTNEINFEIPILLIKTLATANPILKIDEPFIRTRGLKKFFDVVLKSPMEYHSLSELSVAAKVSERTLQYAFKEKFGITPTAFIKFYKLNHIYKALKNETTNNILVSDIANQYGFWHMGQFAKDYKLMFGELPSKTLSQT